MQETRKYVLIQKDLKRIDVLTLKEIEDVISHMDAEELDGFAVFGPVQAEAAQRFEMVAEPGYVGLRGANNELFDEYLSPDEEDASGKVH